MINVFREESVTIITGNGFYYKYKPMNVVAGDDNRITADITNSWVLLFILYDNVAVDYSLTGKIYIFTDSASSFSVTVQ